MLRATCCFQALLISLSEVRLSRILTKVVVWRIKELRKRDKTIEITKPTEDELDLIKEKTGPLTNYAQGHAINTEKMLRQNAV